jgi:hypothetical protein
MRFSRWVALILLLGFWVSFHGQSEIDLDFISATPSFHVADMGNVHDDDSPVVPLAPAGDHKDQHGCYHLHSPFMAVKKAVNFQTASARLPALVFQIPYSLRLTSILHPPRA